MRHGPKQLPVAAGAALVILLMLAGACSPSASSVSNPAQTPVSTTTAPLKLETTNPQVQPADKLGEAPTAVSSKPLGKPVKIGFITPLTGRVAGYGARQKIAVNLAVEDVNNSGGVNGNPLVVVMLDDAADPREAVTLVRRLANEDKVLAIVGPLTSASFEVAAPLANDLRVPLATATSTKPGITDQNRPWIFRFAILEAVVTPRAIEAYKKLYPNVKKVVIAGDTKESVNEYTIRNVYPKALKDAGLELLDTIPFETGTTDFSALVSRIKGMSPDGIAYSSLTPEAIAFSKELQRQGIGAPVAASLQNWGGPEVTLARDTMEGWVAGGTFDEDTQDPRGKGYLDRFVKAAEADPAVRKPAYSGIWTNAYDTVLAIAQVMRAGKVSSETDVQKARTTIQEGLQALKGFKGITGEITVQSNGDVDMIPLPFVAKNGKWVHIK